MCAVMVRDSPFSSSRLYLSSKMSSRYRRMSLGKIGVPGRRIHELEGTLVVLTHRPGDVVIHPVGIIAVHPLPHPALERVFGPASYAPSVGPARRPPPALHRRQSPMAFHTVTCPAL